MNKNIKSGIYTLRNNGESKMIPFNFSTNLRASEKIRFVNNVTNMIVSDDYNLIIKDLIFDLYIIDIFTDVDLTFINESKDSISEIEDFLNNTNIVDIVVANMDNGLLDELKYAINKNIDYQTGIHDNPIADSFVLLLNTIQSKIKEINIDDIEKFIKTMNGITGDFTPEKIVEAYVNTDIFKDRQKELQYEQERHNKKIEDVTETIIRDKVTTLNNNKNVVE